MSLDNIITIESNKDLTIYAIKTPLITPEDELNKIVEEYAKDNLRSGDILFISEKMVAITEGRIFHKNAVKPRIMARILSRFVKQTSYGPGLGLPMTMQIAIWEVGHIRILAACIAGFFGRIFGIKGWFYKIAGKSVSGIDGTDPATIPPYNNYTILIPDDPESTARRIKKNLGMDITVAVVDVNDLGSEILGLSDEKIISRDDLAKRLLSNPLGQTNASTPMGILRFEKSYNFNYSENKLLCVSFIND